jgi:hypothetical protein
VDLDFAVLADAVVARPDGKLDIMGAGFDTVFAPAGPAQHSRLVLAVRVLLSRHETEHEHRLDVVVQAADGAELARGTGPCGPPVGGWRHDAKPQRRSRLVPIPMNHDLMIAVGREDHVLEVEGWRSFNRYPMRRENRSAPDANLGSGWFSTSSRSIPRTAI